MNSAVPARGPSATLKALVADAKTAARERNWATALALGDAALSRFEDAVPSVLYRIMSKAYRGEDRVPEAFAILMRGWAGRRGDDGLVEEIAGLAGSFHSLSDAATFVRECAEAGESLSQSDRRKLEQATRRVVDSVAGEAAAATRNKEWKKAESLWEDILVNFGELAPEKASIELSRARTKLLATAIIEATKASREKDWPRASELWKEILIDRGESALTPIVYVKLSQAHRRLGRLEDAAAFQIEGWNFTQTTRVLQRSAPLSRQAPAIGARP